MIVCCLSGVIKDNKAQVWTRSSAIAKISRVGGHYTVQGQWFWYRSQARMRLPNWCCTVSQVIAQYWSDYCFWQGVSLFNAFVLRSHCEYCHESYVAKY